MASDDVRGTVYDSGGNTVAGATVVIFEQDNVSNIATTTTDANGDYVFDGSTITGDGPWHITARWTDGGGTDYNAFSKWDVQSTIANPTVSTVSITEVDDTTSLLTGNVDNLDGLDSLDVAFDYRQTGAASFTRVGTQTQTSAGNYTHDLTGLSADTEYEMRAVTVSSTPSGFSDQGSLQTWTTTTTADITGLLGRWNFDGSDTSSIVDNYNSNDLNNSGVSIATDSPKENSAYGAFDGSSAEAEGSSSLLPDGDATMMGWFRTNSTGGMMFGTWASTSGTPYGWFIGMDGEADASGGQIGFRMRETSNGDDVRIQTDNAYDDGNWHHLAVVRDTSAGTGAGEITIYVDGSTVPTSTTNDQGSGSFTSDTNVDLGNDDHTSAYYPGDLDDVRLYNVPKTSTEISDIYNNVDTVEDGTGDSGGGEDGSGTNYVAFWEDDPVSPDRAVVNDGSGTIYAWFSDKINNEVLLRTHSTPSSPTVADFTSGWTNQGTIGLGYSGTPKFDVEYQNSEFHMLAGTHGSQDKDYWTSSDGQSWTNQGTVISTSDGDFPSEYDTMKRVAFVHNPDDGNWYAWITANGNNGAETLLWSGSDPTSLSYQGVALDTGMESTLSSAIIGESMWYDSANSEFRGYVGGSDETVGTHTECFYASSSDGLNWTLGSNLVPQSDFPSDAYNSTHMYCPKGAWINGSFVALAAGADGDEGITGDPYGHDMSYAVNDQTATDLTYTMWYAE